MYNPIATYRLQFQKEFSFDDFENALPYFKKLGVSTIYASPIFESVPGSTHGYDGLNPHNINPEIGTEKQFLKLSKELQREGIGWLQDIVPNHMAFDTGNPWLFDVLEKGPRSAYSAFFDVSWTGKIFHGKIMVPFLGSPLTDVIANKELKAEYHNRRFVFNYFDTYYPLNSNAYTFILQECAHKDGDLQGLLLQLPAFEDATDKHAYARQWDEWLDQLSAQLENGPSAALITERLATINNDAQMLTNLANQQEYQLSFWQRTDSKINFRRFFTVNGLIALNIQDEKVFAEHHQYIKKLVANGHIKGLRIDHIDGLYDPSTYLQRLRQMGGDETYIVVEKILEPGEELLQSWPIQGNSGYDYLAIVNNLLTNKNNEDAFTKYYQQLTGDDTPLHQQLLEKKAFILSENMGGELENLVNLFKNLELATAAEMDGLGKDELSIAIGEFLIHCPVYRFYGNTMPLPADEIAAVKAVFAEIKEHRSGLDTALDLLEKALLVHPANNDADYNAKALRFYQRCMQFTGPLMAKGFEDTLMYTYNRFIAHNEVGDSPEAFGISTQEYHDTMLNRQRNWPLTINATSTHDTKRGEDVRARLNVLSDIPTEWFKKVDEWRAMNADLKVNGAPDDNDEYFIYQSLLGVYAMPGQHPDDIVNRLQEYLQKALREAKTNSNWATPNEAYEEAAKSFAVLLLDKQRPFWKSFSEFHHKVADYGVVNSLVQVLLRFTSPGVPDTYQGTELWDLSLVDPDNRRPVDYAKIRLWLHDVEEEFQKHPGGCVANLWANRFNGKIKLWLTHRLFKLRRQYAILFERGDYVPVTVAGAYSNNIIAYARTYKQTSLLVVAPLHVAEICEEQGTTLAQIDWKDTQLVLPDVLKGKTVNLLAHQVMASGKELAVQDVLGTLPLAVISVEQADEQTRAAGVLMHITSLPSAHAVGDLGPEAYRFADFLANTSQKYWQLLPLNPTEAGQGFSPYSSTSSRAGNPLLISLDMLVDEGLLNEEEVRLSRVDVKATADFAEAAQLKEPLFTKAWQAFELGGAKHLQPNFEAFCKREAEWLNDFALFMILKNRFNGKPWYEWPEDYKLRKTSALEQLQADHKMDIEKVKWLQFIFLHQWKQLRTYCNQKNIQLFGDLPFYASYDSVDVWAHPEIFSLDENGKSNFVAGVPPDHFSADGQLWGMPVFNWDVLKENDYKWWMERLKKNMELFDLIRLDHFRAFSDYWQVPAGEETARNGKWVRSPREDFFRVAQSLFGNLPFVAEDLGDIDEPVHELRLQFNLPGMKVLQFAFGDGMPQSTYIPHNYTENFLVYTGTHDNNTTRGWYLKDATSTEKENLNQYAGRAVGSDDVADVLNRLAYSSVAKIAIIPIQDVLELDHTARMNKPSTATNNWAWRLLPGQLTAHAEKHLKFLTKLYNRD